MEWRVYIKGDEYDLEILRRCLEVDDLVIDEDEIGTYISGPIFENYQDSGEAFDEAHRLLPTLIGVARTAVAGFGTLELTGNTRNGANGTISVRTSVTIMSTVRVRAEGQVSVNGVPVKDTLPETMAKLWAASQTPSLEGAITKYGTMTTPNWFDLYKIFELLRKLAGGEKALARQSGVSSTRVDLLKLNSNHPDFHGDDSRHAVPEPGKPPKPEKRITVEDGSEIIRELISGMQKHREASAVPPAAPSANPSS